VKVQELPMARVRKLKKNPASPPMTNPIKIFNSMMFLLLINYHSNKLKSRQWDSIFERSHSFFLTDSTAIK
jgi:hypothetical protein